MESDAGLFESGQTLYNQTKEQKLHYNGHQQKLAFEFCILIIFFLNEAKLERYGIDLRRKMPLSCPFLSIWRLK